MMHEMEGTSATRLTTIRHRRHGLGHGPKPLECRGKLRMRECTFADSTRSKPLPFNTNKAMPLAKVKTEFFVFLLSICGRRPIGVIHDIASLSVLSTSSVTTCFRRALLFADTGRNSNANKFRCCRYQAGNEFCFEALMCVCNEPLAKA